MAWYIVQPRVNFTSPYIYSTEAKTYCLTHLTHWHVLTAVKRPPVRFTYCNGYVIVHLFCDRSRKWTGCFVITFRGIWLEILVSWSSGLWHRVVMPPSSGWSLRLEDGGGKFLRNVGILPHQFAVSQPRRPRHESSCHWDIWFNF
jgi:hypothetical protein